MLLGAMIRRLKRLHPVAVASTMATFLSRKKDKQ
jgi:hypothetical protein